MNGLLGAAVFWLAGHYLARDGADVPAVIAWALMTLLALCCGLLHWHGDHDRWVGRIVHFIGLLALVAGYVAYWDGIRAAADSLGAGWPLATWLVAGVALPLGLALLAPARPILEGFGGGGADDDDDD